MKLVIQEDLGHGHIVLGRLRWRPSSPSPMGQFSAHICCGQMAGWIKMFWYGGVDLGPGDFVLDGDPAPPPKKRAEPPPQFSVYVYCGQTVGWINMAWHGGRPRSRPHCARRRPRSSPPKRGQTPNFRSMSIVPERPDGSTCHLVRR